MLTESSYWARRVRRHFSLATLALAVVCLAYVATPPPDIRHRVSMATAYAGMAFLAVSLCLGPWNVLQRRPNPVSFDLRRDLGIWAGVIAIVHTVVGLTVHLRGRMWMYFFRRLHPLALQNTRFGLANFSGLAAALLFFVLLQCCRRGDQATWARFRAILRRLSCEGSVCDTVLFSELFGIVFQSYLAQCWVGRLQT
jgi:DMSO/TMAO reductase YedYZ heme-binding membrane subunit